MEIIDFEYPNIPSSTEKIVLCLGYFDGVHLGHQTLINNAKKEGYKVAVLTYDNSPAVVLGKTKDNHCLTSISDKADFFEQLGVDFMYLMHFDLEVAKLSKDQYITEVLKVINPIKIYCGEDHRYGLFGDGDVEYLKRFFDVEVQSLVDMNDVKVSSRDIRSYVENGDIAKANELLGKPYRINGLVVEGLHNGKNLDFPTANLALDYPYAFPKDGVYYGYADVYDKRYKAIISVGTHPTIMQLKKSIIEVHILDYEGNLYGKDIFAEFVLYARDNIKFNSVDELIAQLKKDKQKANKLLPDIE